MIATAPITGRTVRGERAALPPVWPGLARCDHLLAEHLAEAVQRFGTAALGQVDLPPITSGSLSPAQIRVAAVLLWAREVEAAGLLALVETLAEGIVKGTVMLPLREGASKLVRHHRGREERFGPDERHELYARVLGEGDPVRNPVAGQLEALVSALGEVGRAPPDRSTHHLQARVNVIGRDLAGMLSDRSVGLAAYAARDIVAQVRAALALLDDADIAQALGGGGAWNIVRVHSPSLLGRAIEPGPHLARARAGQTIVSWLADAAARLEQGTARVSAQDPVVSAALTWAAESGVA